MFSLDIFKSNYMFSTKPIIFNIAIDSSSLNVFSSSFSHLLKIVEGTNVSLKMYDILDFLNFSYLAEIMQPYFPS